MLPLCFVIDQAPSLNLTIARFVAAKHKRFCVRWLKQAGGLQGRHGLIRIYKGETPRRWRN
jgi:hypothetical protein